MNRKMALQKLWKDTCTVVVREKVTDEQTKITDFVEITLFQDQPCKLSFESLAAADDGNAAAITQSAKLFIDSDLEIPPGSKITVTRQGREYAYQRSGEAGVFTYHQEIMLEPWRRWA